MPPTASLRVQNYDFMAVWAEIRVGCEALLRWSERVTDKGASATQPKFTALLADLFSKVYRLASNSCTNVPNLVRGKDSEPVNGKDEQSTQVLVLYYLLRELIRNHLEHFVKPKVQNPSTLLGNYLDCWTHYSSALVGVSAVFKYQNNHWSQQGLPVGHVTMSTTALGHQLWTESILNPVKQELEKQISRLIALDRDGTAVDTWTVKSVLASLVQLGTDPRKQTGIYNDVFELKFVASTDALYAELSDRWLREGGGSTESFIDKALAALSDELRRVDRFLDKSTTAPLRKVLVQRLVESKAAQLLAPASTWITNGDFQKLSKLYTLLSYSDTCLEPLQKVVEDRIYAEGREEISKIAADATKEPSVLITTILLVYRKYKVIVEHNFDNNKALVAALETGSRRFVNENQHFSKIKCAEFLAKYAHALLRPATAQSKAAADNLEQAVCDMLSIFKLLDDADVFQMSYAAYLSQRLIYNAFTKEAEELVIQKFRDLKGREFVHKWQRMFLDATVQSANFKMAFEAEVDPTQLSFEFSPVVLTSGAWPSTTLAEKLRVPMELLSVFTLFEQSYKRLCGGRSLQWLGNFSNGAVRTNHALTVRKTFDAQVSHWQLVFLLLFNRFPQNVDAIVSYQQFKDAAGTSDDQALQRALVPLVKQKFILASEVGTDPAAQRFQLNPAFTSQNRKLNFHMSGGGIAVPTADVRDEGAVGATAQIHHERKFAVQAAIVRVLKSRRSMSYPDLLREVGSVLSGRFKPTAQDVKTNLEVLLEKEFVERSADDPNIFLYVSN